jgi:hypothetical protein
MSAGSQHLASSSSTHTGGVEDTEDTEAMEVVNEMEDTGNNGAPVSSSSMPSTELTQEYLTRQAWKAAAYHRQASVLKTAAEEALRQAFELKQGDVTKDDVLRVIKIEVCNIID